MVIIIDRESACELYFDQGGEVVVFDRTQPHEALRRDIYVSGGTRVRWYGVVSGECIYALHFHTDASSESVIRMILTATQTQRLDVAVHSTLLASHSMTNLHILSLVGDMGSIVLNGTVQIDSNIQKVKGHILEENIFLGSRGNIRGIPSLLVHSDDVEAGHAARIERVSDEKLYYLRARGIPRDDATMMMIQSAVTHVIDGLDEAYQTEVFEVVEGMFRG